MERTYPDSIPAALQDYCRNRNNLALSRLSLDMGFWDGYIRELFEGEQKHLSKYCHLANAGGISLQELVDLIRNGSASVYIDGLISSIDGVKDRVSLAKEIKVSPTFINSLYRNSRKLNGLNSYVKIAEWIGRPIDDLRCQREASSKISA